MHTLCYTYEVPRSTDVLRLPEFITNNPYQVVIGIIRKVEHSKNDGDEKDCGVCAGDDEPR